MSRVFSEGEVADVKDITQLYLQAKALILYAEEIDVQNKSNLQIINELRNAFDHFMRVLHRKLIPGTPFIKSKEEEGEDEEEDGNESCDEEGYHKGQLDKAKGHIYRAAFDALDGTVLTLKSKVEEELRGFPIEIIKEIYPDYYNVKRKLNELVNNVSSHREKKDIGGDTGTGEIFDNYVADIESLKIVHENILSDGPLLVERLKEYKQNKRRPWAIAIIAGIIGSTIGGLLVYFIINNYTKNEQSASPNISKQSTLSTP